MTPPDTRTARRAAAPRPSAQRQTAEAFGYKWARRETYEGDAVRQAARQWMTERYCGGDARRLDAWLAGGRRRIVDAGCGAGHSALAFFGARLREHDYIGIDISSAVDVARVRFAEAGLPARFVRADLSHAPLADGSVDLLLAEGVLHHTDDTGVAFARLARSLAPGGRFLCYVYARKGPIREFTDDHVREALRPLSDDDAWDALRSLTRLGLALGRLAVTVDVPEDIPMLGIRRGPVDVQRLFYWSVCKAFYRPDFTEDEMHHVNYDWFRPLNCHRHEPDELRAWCRRAGLTIEHLDVQDAGISVVAVRPPEGQA